MWKHSLYTPFDDWKTLLLSWRDRFDWEQWRFNHDSDHSVQNVLNLIGQWKWSVSSWSNAVGHVSQRAPSAVGVTLLNWLVASLTANGPGWHPLTMLVFIDHWACQMSCLLPHWLVRWLKTLWPVAPEGLCFSEAPWQRLWQLRWKTYCLSSEAKPWSSHCGSSTSDCCLKSNFGGRSHWYCASPGTPGSGGCQRSPMAPFDQEPFAWTWPKRKYH